MYRNARRGWIPYLGLGVDDGMRGKVATVDMHKQEATNGCIFIVDPATPEMDDPDPNKLGEFEPKLIRDILAAVDARKRTRRAGSISARCTWSTSSELTRHPPGGPEAGLRRPETRLPSEAPAATPRTG